MSFRHTILIDNICFNILSLISRPKAKRVASSNNLLYICKYTLYLPLMNLYLNIYDKIFSFQHYNESIKENSIWLKIINTQFKPLFICWTCFLQHSIFFFSKRYKYWFNKVYALRNFRINYMLKKLYVEVKINMADEYLNILVWK